MDILNYIILGIVEGITEFLPISSTAHLILFSFLLKIEQTEFHKFFEVFIQSGAILAIIFNYFKFLIFNKNLIKKIVVSFIPTALISLFFYQTIKNIFFENRLLIISMLIIIGAVFILVENLIKKDKIKLIHHLDTMSYFQALLIGTFQALAIIPGISRAGAVILGMLFLKFKREDAVLYSFFLALPTIISAGIYDLYKVGYDTTIFNFQNFIYLLTGLTTSFIFALITIKWFIIYLQKNNLIIFGYYRIILGLILLKLFISKSQLF